MKIYFNPFTGIIKKIENDKDPLLNSLKMTFNELWDFDTTIENLKLLAYTKEKCFGKFDMFNKWILYKTNIKELNEPLKLVYLKPNDICCKCKFLEKCSSIHIPLKELEVIWDKLYKSNIQFLKEVSHD